uniref:Uncharacterized protein n=1 Tax=Arundo donax TaxID=35708 RepID=A0A0A9G562_ARUDO
MLFLVYEVHFRLLQELSKCAHFPALLLQKYHLAL